MYTSYFDASSAELNKEQAQDIGKEAAAIAAGVVTSAAIGAISGLATSLLVSAIVTNYNKQSVSGNKTLTPTEDVTALDCKETAAAHQDSQLAHEEFKAQESSLAGINTDANGANAKTDATTADVAAAKTEAGTIDTSATAMQIN